MADRCRDCDCNLLPFEHRICTKCRDAYDGYETATDGRLAELEEENRFLRNDLEQEKYLTEDLRAQLREAETSGS